MTVGADEGTTTRRRLSQQSDRVRLIARLRRHLRHRGAAFVVDHDDGACTRTPSGVGILTAGMRGGDDDSHDGRPLECRGLTTTITTGDREEDVDN